MDRRFFGLVSAVFALGLVASACGGGGGGNEASASASAAPSASATAEGGGTITINGEKANNHGSKDVSESSSLDLEADDFYFSPTVLTGSPGQKLTIKVENEGSATHNFSLDQQGVSEDVSPGQDTTVTVTFPKSGELEFYCKFHRSSGMIGELTTS